MHIYIYIQLHVLKCIVFWLTNKALWILWKGWVNVCSLCFVQPNNNNRSMIINCSIKKTPWSLIVFSRYRSQWTTNKQSRHVIIYFAFSFSVLFQSFLFFFHVFLSCNPEPIKMQFCFIGLPLYSTNNQLEFGIQCIMLC